MTTALAALGHGQHVVVYKFDKTPGSGDREKGLNATRGDLLGVEPVRLHDGVNVIELTHFGQVLISVQKQRGVDVGLPSQKPVG